MARLPQSTLAITLCCPIRRGRSFPSRGRASFGRSTHEKNLEQIRSVCRKLARFKPTVICVEIEPKQQRLVEKEYETYLKDPSLATRFEGEVQLLGFEIGRLANTKRIVPIDHKMDYDYKLGEFAKRIAADEYTLIQSGLEARVKEFVAPVTSLQQTLLKYNTQESYDFFINYNADKLVYANSKNGFEGADEAAKYYHRNLRMFANINKISLDGSDRVLIISGASHAAYFNMFMKRSPRYRLVQLETFLK